jgi:long-subunit acyl-CoA synthetase (AMP-forming)
VCYLPLSHVAEQVISVFAPMLVGGCIAFAESLEALAVNLREIRPTFFFGVPRVWEKIQARMEAVGAQSGFVKRYLARWARRVGLESGYAAQRGEGPVRGFALADKLVFQKVRRRLGFDRVRFFATSAAPISTATLEFFLSLGMPLLEVYGMTECSGPGTLSRPDRYRTGWAGYTLPDTELSLAEDGEILMRGAHVFQGYFKNPEATHDALDAAGWLHSGDIGVMGEDGFLKVVDRKKELIITSGGKNIAPVPIELKLKSIPGVALAVVVGNGRKFLTALLTLDPDRVASVAASVGSVAETVEDVASCPRFRTYLEDEVTRINGELASYEGIKRFTVLADQLSVEAKTLTPTLKLRRRNIAEFYRHEIEELYEDGEKVRG